ncbi:unnamed protein product [Leuciscus chuanchicus]
MLTENTAHLKALEAELNTLIADKTALKQKQWQVQLQMMDLEKKAAKASFDRNSIPGPVYLPEVQKSLTKIQDILIQLKNFWESVGQLLDSLEQTTFVGEALIEDLDELKDVFLDSIKIATEAWSCFGAGCQQASVIFKLQNKDAYKFLEVSPSSLSKEEWEKEYESVKKQLEEIDLPQSDNPQTRPVAGRMHWLADGCISKLPHMDFYILDEGVLRLASAANQAKSSALTDMQLIGISYSGNMGV